MSGDTTMSHDTLVAALARFQHNLPKIAKTEVAKVRSDKGNYSYTYADLADVSAHVLPLLGEVGLSFSTRPTLNDAGQFVLAYELAHTSGETRTGQYPLPGNATPQQLGSAITYGRRYCLCAVTGVAPDDDDDAAAAQTTGGRHDPEQARVAELKKHIWSVAQQVGITSVDELTKDYAARYQGLVLADAAAEELQVYLNTLSDQTRDTTEEAA